MSRKVEAAELDRDLDRVEYSCDTIDPIIQMIEKVRGINSELRELAGTAIEALADLESDYADREDEIKGLNARIEDLLSEKSDLEIRVMELEHEADQSHSRGSAVQLP